MRKIIMSGLMLSMMLSMMMLTVGCSNDDDVIAITEPPITEVKCKAYVEITMTRFTFKWKSKKYPNTFITVPNDELLLKADGFVYWKDNGEIANPIPQTEHLTQRLNAIPIEVPCGIPYTLSDSYEGMKPYYWKGYESGTVRYLYE